MVRNWLRTVPRGNRFVQQNSPHWQPRRQSLLPWCRYPKVRRIFPKRRRPYTTSLARAQGHSLQQWRETEKASWNNLGVQRSINASQGYAAHEGRTQRTNTLDIDPTHIEFTAISCASDGMQYGETHVI